MVVEMDVPKSFLEMQDVAHLLDINQTAVWIYSEVGALPPPVKLCGVTRWRRIDIQQWAGKSE